MRYFASDMYEYKHKVPMYWKESKKDDPFDIMLKYFRDNYWHYEGWGDWKLVFAFDDGKFYRVYYEYWEHWGEDEEGEHSLLEVPDYFYFEELDSWEGDEPLPKDVKRNWLLINDYGIKWIPPLDKSE